MAYQKQKVKKVKVSNKPKKAPPETVKMDKKKSIENKDNERAPLRSSSFDSGKAKARKPKAKRSFKVIDGGKLISAREHKKGIILSSIAFIVVIIFLGLQFLTPTGMVDAIQNGINMIGSGNGLPVTVPGNKAKGLAVRGNTLFALTDTSLYAYNSSGKEVISFQHGYSNPTLVVSGARTLIYDRGNTGLRVDTLAKNITTTATENSIYTADICDKGYIAAATSSSTAASELTVWDKKAENVRFSYKSSGDLISCVKLSNSGKKVAFATIGEKDGTYSSHIYIYNVSNGKKLGSVDLENSMIVKLASSNSTLFAVSSNKTYTFDWECKDLKEQDYSDLAYFIDQDTDNITVGYHPSGDKRKTNIAVYKPNGEKRYEITVNGDISKLSASSFHVYVFNGNTVNKYDTDGELEDTFSTGYQYVYIAAYKHGIGVFSDMKLNYNS